MCVLLSVTEDIKLKLLDEVKLRPYNLELPFLETTNAETDKKTFFLALKSLQNKGNA